MAITLVTSASGSGSDNSTTPVLSNIQAGDLVLLACTGGDKSSGIPNTTGEAPAQGTSTGGISGSTNFTLQVQTNSAPARLSIWSRYWTGTDTQVHLGSGWSGQGNHYVLIVLRGVDSAAGSIVAGSITGPNTSLAITEPSPGAGWAEYGYAAFWSHERNGTFSSPAPTGFAIATQSSGNKGSACVSYDLDRTAAVTNISISHPESGKESSEAALVFKMGATSNDEVRSQGDTSEASDQQSTTKEAQAPQSESAEALDSISSEKTSFETLADTFEVSDSQEFVKGKEAPQADTLDANDSLSFVKSLNLPISDGVESADSQSAEKSITEAFADTVESEDGQTPHKGVNESYTDTIDANDSIVTEKGKFSSIEDSADAEDSQVLNKSLSVEFLDASGIEDSQETEKGKLESFTDAVESADSVESLKHKTFGITDPVEAEDSTSSEKAVFESVSDSAEAKANDPAIQTTGAEFATPQDETSASDTVLVEKSVFLDDSSSFSDGQVPEKTILEGLSDSISAEDSQAPSLGDVESISDSADIEDALTLQKNLTQEIQDGVSADIGLVPTKQTSSGQVDYERSLSLATSTSDLLENVLGRLPVDATSVTESLTPVKNITLSISDSIETLDAQVEVKGKVRTLSEGVTAEKTVSTFIGYALEFTDVLEAGDTRSLSETHLVTDEVTSADALVGLRSAFASISDSVDTEDEQLAIRGKVANPSDGVSVTEEDKLDIAISMLDLAGPNDLVSISISVLQQDPTSVSDLQNASRVHFDSAGAQDAIETLLTIGLSTDIIGRGSIVGNSPPELLTKGEALALIDIYNTALNALGVGTVTATTDSSPQATILNNIWPSFRKQFLADYSWNGAKKTIALSRLQTHAGVDVVPVGDRWSYAYVLPTDYLRVLRINGYERFNATQRGRNAFEIEVINYADSSTTTADKRCLITDETTVNLEYIFDPGNEGIDLLGARTAHALGLSLAHHVARNFGKTPQEIQVLADDARRAVSDAKGVDGQEKTQRLRPDLGLLESRHWWVG